MNARPKILIAGLVLGAVAGCRARSSDSDVAAASLPSSDSVIGTYFGADSGHNLGKDWCYSAALVLDSTKHFGSVIRMCSDDGSGPVTDTLKGTYHFRTRTLRVSGVGRVRRTYVVLDADGQHRNSHTLRYANGTLRFDEPWWMGAGLRALDIPDPVLKKISVVATADSGAAVKTSSTPASLTRTQPAKSTGTAARKSAAK